MLDLFKNIYVAMPEWIILISACVALLSEIVSSNKNNAAYYISLTGLALAGFFTFCMLGQYTTVLYHSHYINDGMATIMKLFICITVFLSFYYSKQYLIERDMPRGEYHILGLLSTLGMMILVSGHSLLILYLGIELLSLPVYALVAFRRGDGLASEGSIKYFIMGAIASGILLYGMSLLFAATGKLDLNEISNAIAVSWPHHTGILSFALVFIVAGIGFKLAAIPFHMWAPDVYEGAPSSVTLFISAAPKIAAFGLLIRILSFAVPGLIGQWQQLILILAILSIGFGNTFALVQTDIKRLVAYSAISHTGFALFGVLAGDMQGFSASLFYIVMYAIMSTGLLGLIVVFSNEGLEISKIDDLAGLNKRNPWFAFIFLILLFSMAGIPPTVGFFIKLSVLKALVDAGMLWVATLGLIFAVIGAFYYLRLVKIMYFDEPNDFQKMPFNYGRGMVLSLNALVLLYLGLFPHQIYLLFYHAFS